MGVMPSAAITVDKRNYVVLSKAKDLILPNTKGTFAQPDEILRCAQDDSG